MTIPGAPPTRKKSAKPSPPSGARSAQNTLASKRETKARFEIDRIVLMRLGLLAIVVTFLYLVVWMGMRVFGRGDQQFTRMDRIVKEVTNGTARSPSGGGNPAAPKSPDSTTR